MTGREVLEDEPFGKGMDYVDAVVRGLVLFCIVTAAAFLGYQEGDGAFRPLLYATALLCLSVFYTWCLGSCTKEVQKRRHVAGSLVLAGWLGLSAFIRECPVIFGLMGIVTFGYALFCQKVYKGQKGRALMRFRQVKYYKRYGIALWVCAVLVLAESADASEQYPVSAETCVRYMVFAFMAYLVCGIALRYFKEEYQHFRNKTEVQKKTLQTTRRMNKTVLAWIAFCFAALLLFLRKTLINGFGFLLRKVLYYVAKAGFMGLDLMDLSWLNKLFGTGSSGSSAESGMPKTAGLLSDYGDEMNYILMAVGIVIFVIVFLMILRNYKRSGASYVIEEEEAVYIKDSDTVSEMRTGRRMRKMNFGSDNAGKIRRMFYGKVNQQLTPEQAKQVRTKTAREIVDEYTKEEGLSHLTQCYEKARYAKECTPEDVQRAQESLKKVSEL